MLGDKGAGGRYGREALGRAELADENRRLQSEVQRLRQANGELSRTVDGLRAEAGYFRENRPINTYLRLARSCYDRAADCRSEAYIAHGVEALPAANVVAAAVGGRVYCDVIEVPSFTQRSVVYNWHPSNFSLLDHAFDSYLSEAAGLVTIGWALKERLRHYGPPINVIPNYRYAEQLRPSNELRERCGLGSGDRLLLAPSTICLGFDAIVEALRLLPENVHLATLGLISDPAYVHSLPGRFGVSNRVHFFDEVPYDQLTSIASGADLGLMALDPSTVNDQISLPNRLFDCLAAGLPIVTPDVPDVARIVEERSLGVTLPRNEAACWADAVKAALERKEALRENVMVASKELVWENLSDRIHSALGYAASVTFFGYRNLIGHQRTARMVDTLLKRGVKVTICCPYTAAAKPDMQGVKLVLLPSPLPAQGPAPPNSPEAVAPPAVATLATTAGVKRTEPDRGSVGPAIPASGPTAERAAAPSIEPTAAGGAPLELAAEQEEPQGVSLSLQPSVGSILAPAQTHTRAEHVAIERLKKEVMALRFKAKRYDEIKAEREARRSSSVYNWLTGRKFAAYFNSWRRGLTRLA